LSLFIDPPAIHIFAFSVFFRGYFGLPFAPLREFFLIYFFVPFAPFRGYFGFIPLKRHVPNTRHLRQPESSIA